MTSQLNLNAICIATYVANLAERTDRLAHIKQQFEGRDEFELKVIKAERHAIGNVGLWRTLCKIVQLAVNDNDDVIIFCEDDHVFTPHYNKELLLKQIIENRRRGAEILSSGVSFFDFGFPVAEGSFWINEYFGNQFLVVYKAMFQKILNAKFKETDHVDKFLSSLTKNKLVICPFISTQVFTPYSDVTPYNQQFPERVASRFLMAENKMKYIQNMFRQYHG